MISPIAIFLIAPGLFAQKAIYNSLYQACRTNSSSQNGCGPNLVCIAQSFYYSQCLPSSQLDNSFLRTCGKSLAGCPMGSFCPAEGDYCSPCKSEFTSCETVVGSDFGCCPGSTCTAVSAYVNGEVQEMKICLSESSLEKRRVGFCYSRCPTIPLCPFGRSLCASAGSGALAGKSPVIR